MQKHSSMLASGIAKIENHKNSDNQAKSYQSCCGANNNKIDFRSGKHSGVIQKPMVKRVDIQQLDGGHKHSGSFAHEINFRHSNNLLQTQHNQSLSHNFGTIEYFTSQPSSNSATKSNNFNLLKSTSSLLPSMPTA